MGQLGAMRAHTLPTYTWPVRTVDYDGRGTRAFGSVLVWKRLFGR